MSHSRMIVLVLMITLMPLAACGANSAAAGSDSGTPVPEVSTDRIVSATGEVRPARWAALGFAVDGQVKSLLVEEGQTVISGQPLIELDAVRLERASAEAQAALTAAEADLARLQAGAHPQEVAAAEQAIAAAQLHDLLPTLSALENVKVPMRGQPIGRRERRKRALELLDLAGLPNRAGYLPSQLSGGQRQKVAIARALANRPRLILADEPTGNLDSQSGAEVMGLLRRLNAELGTTVVIVTHDSTVAHQTGRILVMRDGCLVHEHPVGTAYEEDLESFLDSGLGRALLAGDASALSCLDAAGQAALRRLLPAAAPATSAVL